MKSVSTSPPGVTRLIAEVDNCATSWRCAADDAKLAFAWWTLAGPDDRDAAAASYLAAIEREEKAAQEYGRAARAYRDRCRLVATAPRGRNRRRWRLSYDDT
jgi:hypothetical protein